MPWQIFMPSVINSSLVSDKVRIIADFGVFAVDLFYYSIFVLRIKGLMVE